MRRSLLLLTACVSAACASGGTNEDTMGKAPAIFQSSGDGTVNGEAPRSTAATIAAPAATVYLAVKTVYADLDIPITIDNPTQHQLGNSSFVKTRQLGGHSMVEFVNCGNGMDGPKAGYYRMYLSLVTQVNPDGKGGTNLQTLLIATGQDMGGSATDRLTCGSTGRLELLLIDKVKAAIAAK